MKSCWKKLLAYAAALVLCVQGGAVFASAEGTASAVTELTVAEYPDVMAYHIGDELITDGIRVEASYEDGTKADVTADCTFDYDFSEKGNAEVEVAYEGKTTNYGAVVVPEKFSIYTYDPVGGRIDDNGYYIFKEGETLENSKHHYAMHYAVIIDDADQSEVGMVELSADQISGFTPSLGKKTLTGHVPIGDKIYTYTFPAVVLNEEEYRIYDKVWSDWLLYSHAGFYANWPDNTPFHVSVNFDGAINANNLGRMLAFAELYLSENPFWDTVNNPLPLAEVQKWLEKAMVITSFDVKGSPYYNPQDDTIIWEGGWGYGGDGVPFYHVKWNRGADGSLTADFEQSIRLVYSSDNRLVSITELPEKLELVSVPSKTAYKQGEKLDLTGGQIKAIYDEKRSEVLPLTADMISGYDPAKAGKQTVTVTVGNQSVSFDVTVTASENKPSVIIDDKETGIKMETAGGVVPPDTVIRAEQVTTGGNFTIINDALAHTSHKWEAYDIRLLADNAEIQPNGKVKITMPVPKGFNKNKMALFHVAADGKLTQIPFTLDKTKDHLIFETDHFSLYVVAEMNEANNGSANPPTGDGVQGAMPLAVGLFLIAGAAVLLLHKRRTAE